jgi:hypothetical protein
MRAQRRAIVGKCSVWNRGREQGIQGSVR